MSDEAATSAPSEVHPAPVVNESPDPAKPQEDVKKKEANGEQHEGGDAQEEAEAGSPDVAKEGTGKEGNGHAETADDASPAAENPATPASSKKGKRKSSSGIPEHKTKKPNKKNQPTLNLKCKPGEHYWARLKGFPPWPAIICDEGMLPEILLATRPISTTRPDGSIRQDFEEGGKNAKDRTFPVMFLSTNEFCWMANIHLTPLDTEEIKEKPTSKLSKSLKHAYELAAEDHELGYYKDLIKQFQDDEKAFLEEQARIQEQAEKDAATKAAEKAEEGETKKKKSRKSKGGSEDVEMANADAPKSSKKRKKDTESDSEGSKPKKTPKVTKLNAPKTPNGQTTASAKKSSSKPRKKVVAPKEDEKEKAPDMTEEERYAIREKSVLFLRHKLQKCFLARDKAPEEKEMETMAGYFTQLEEYEDLQPAIIRTTKIHKVLKGVIKLASIPKEDEYHFKDRSHVLLNEWNKRMEGEGDALRNATETKSAVSESVPAISDAPVNGENSITNGEKKADDKEVARIEDQVDEKEPETKEEEEADEATKNIDNNAAKLELAGGKEAKAGDKTEKDDGKPAEPSNEAALENEGDISMVTAPET
ncbi:hypothetical protein K431DRAFT_283019 [Polychaeton citri CBS 116435]|uniref:PWWP domain-containing protein n=1 Tax=Polychaeton citri CBS 116435 TaxID=1314669 RepID=A0A9P4QEH3_9PEZI|nr:hypothetical protein K431DRAFT_283019 [Polychaeton citri CBS 116435]